MLLILVPVLLAALVTPGPGNRFHWRRRRGYRWAGAGAPFVVAAGSLIVPAPVLLLAGPPRSLSVLDWAAVVLAPAAAFVVTRRVIPPWWKRSWLRIGVRAGLLLGLVVAAQWLTGGVFPTYRAGVVSLIVTMGWLGFWRVLDTGYWPLLLIRDGIVLLVIAGGAAGWQRRFDPRAVAPAELAVTLLIAMLALAGVGAAVAGGWRLRRWLRYGPPCSPQPPGVATWPPEPGQVWNVAIRHEDRPVVVWERGAHHATVLPVTAVDPGARDRHLRLPLAEWHRVLTGDAWLSLQLTPVPYADFRSVRGDCPERFWSRVGRHQIRAPRTFTPSLTFRHRLHTAMNRRAER